MMEIDSEPKTAIMTAPAGVTTGDGRPKIVWLADVPGWAYHNRARAMSAVLSDYDHIIIMNPIENYSDAVMAIAHADLVVCPDPRLMKYLPIGNMTILHVNAIKLFIP